MRENDRTVDVTDGAESFSDLLLPEFLLRALDAAGFSRPSPVQTTAIPLARVGADLVVQAKSGTGKTLVFGIPCVENAKLIEPLPQALVLTPTREIALQVAAVLRALAAEVPDLVIGTLIGGLPIEDDQKLLRRRCHIAVGTPGRVGSLLEAGTLQPSAMKMLVLDEADQLMTESFAEDVRWICGRLPARKQVLAVSATYTPALLAQLEQLMREPQRVLLSPETTSLLGVRQFYSLVPEDLTGEPLMEAKIAALLALTARLTFHQAVIFCNSRPDGEYLADKLAAAGMPAAFLAGGQPQAQRMRTLGAVRGFRLRVIVSTDLVARGVDLSRVNLVANLDLPRDAATYMHRVGRTGRYGTRGVAVTFVTPAELARLTADLEGVAGGRVEELPDIIPEELYVKELDSAEERALFEQLKSSHPADVDSDSFPTSGRPLNGHQKEAANGHSAFGSWSLEQNGDSVADVMRALRPTGEQPAAAAVPRQQVAAPRPADEDDDEEENVSWWDVDLPTNVADRGADAAAESAEDLDTEGAAGTTVWQRSMEVGAKTAEPPASGPNSGAAQRQSGVETAEQQTGAATSDQVAFGASACEADAPLTEAHYTAEQQWRLAYEQWYAAYMHWYASYEQWHAGYQQHCASQVQTPEALGGTPARAEQGPSDQLQ